MEWLLQSYFSWKFNRNRHIEHENPLSIYENMDYFQIMNITNLEWFCINCSMIYQIAIRLSNMPVLPLVCHLPTQYTTHTITLQQWTNNKTNKSYKQLINIHISCKCDTNRAGHFTLDAHASRPVACFIQRAICRKCFQSVSSLYASL